MFTKSLASKIPSQNQLSLVAGPSCAAASSTTIACVDAKTHTIVAHNVKSSQVRILSKSSTERIHSIKFAAARGTQLLVIATDESISVYDVGKDDVVAHLDVQATAVEVGRWLDHKTLIFTGGDCLVMGYDVMTGEECYMNVTGDIVTALAVNDIDKNSKQQLLVASQDNMIRIYQEEDIIDDIQTPSTVTHLKPCQNGFVAVTENGIVIRRDVAKKKWCWKYRSSGSISCVAVGNDLVAMANHTSIDILSMVGGTRLFSETLDQPVCGLFFMDLHGRQDELVVVLRDGTLFGFVKSEKEKTPSSTSTKLQQKIQDLEKRKKELKKRLKNVQSGKKTQLPSVQCRLQHKNCSLELVLSLSNNESNFQIKNVLYRSEELCDGQWQSLTSIVNNKDGTAVMVLQNPDKDVATTLQLKIIFHDINISDENDFCLSAEVQIPRFAMYTTQSIAASASSLPLVERLPSGREITPQSQVTCHIPPVSLEDIHKWVSEAFCVGSTSEPMISKLANEFQLVSLRDGSATTVRIASQRLIIKGDSMHLASALADSFYSTIFSSKPSTVNKCELDFKKDIEHANALVMQLKELGEIQKKQMLYITRRVSMTRNSLSVLDEARKVRSWEEMQSALAELNHLTAGIINQHKQRQTTYKTWISSESELNEFVQIVPNFYYDDDVRAKSKALLQNVVKTSGNFTRVLQDQVVIK